MLTFTNDTLRSFKFNERVMLAIIETGLLQTELRHHGRDTVANFYIKIYN